MKYRLTLQNLYISPIYLFMLYSVIVDEVKSDNLTIGQYRINYGTGDV